MSLKSIHDRIILKPIMEMAQTAGGITIPFAGTSKMGRVVAIGKGRLLDDGSYKTPEVKVGDTVLVNQFSELQNEDGLFWVTTEKDILGVIDPT